MGVEDRDWYWEERRRKEGLYYSPKSFRRSNSDAGAAPRGRPGFWVILAIAFVLALAFAPTVGRWWRDRLAERAAASIEPGVTTVILFKERAK